MLLNLLIPFFLFFAGRPMHDILYACVDDLDLDARSLWLGRGKKCSVELSRQLIKQ